MNPRYVGLLTWRPRLPQGRLIRCTVPGTTRLTLEVKSSAAAEILGPAAAPSISRRDLMAQPRQKQVR